MYWVNLFHEGLLCTASDIFCSCATCHQDRFTCPGHPGHIELSRVAYHPSFFDVIFKLLKTQCACCGGFRLARAEVHRYAYKLHLLRYGLLEEAAEFDDLTQKTTASVADTTTDLPEESEDSLEVSMEQWDAFVREAIGNAKEIDPSLKSVNHKNESVQHMRRELIKRFLSEASSTSICARCNL